jgi:WhiB family transcriptional regulator, redox-sensing transcriptional regulator
MTPGEWVGKNSRADYSAQRAVCAGCPVRQACLDYALAIPDLMGCWAGTDETERRELRKARVA